MIINSLHASNFRKYHKLEITDIPNEGIITLEGANESGKTSIGEAICFALFGRTFSLDEKSLHKVICWGEDLAKVTLKFTVDYTDHYILTRSYNRDGERTVSLKKELVLGENDSSQISLNTEEKVNLALAKILGFDYKAFSSSFYLAQRELTTPDPNSNTIKQMAGIADYANITKKLEKSIQEHKEKINKISPDAKTIKANLDSIAIDETWLPDLVDAETTLVEEQRHREKLLSTLEKDGPTYTNNLKHFHRAKHSRFFWNFFAVLSFPIAIVSWLFWALFKYRPEIYEDIIRNSIGSEKLPTMLDIASNYFLPVAIASTLIFLLCLLFEKLAVKKLRTFYAESQEISSNMQEGHYLITTQVETLLPERIVQLFNERTKEKSTLLIIPPREQFANLSQLAKSMPMYKANKDDVNKVIASLSGSLKSQDLEIADLERSLIDDIEQERLRSDDAGKLRSTLQVLNRTMAGHQYETDVEQVSIGLLQRAATDSIDQFNKNIAELSAKVLPKFTENRYSRIRIATNLSVQVYSDDKKDYMEFDEISSGTQRQIMLALRIAMSEELSINSGNDQQFIFLDEPFAYFDQARTRSTLKTLPVVSDVISQIWVVSQEFPKDISADKAIKCPEDNAELLA